MLSTIVQKCINVIRKQIPMSRTMLKIRSLNTSLGNTVELHVANNTAKAYLTTLLIRLPHYIDHVK